MLTTTPYFVVHLKPACPVATPFASHTQLVLCGGGNPLSRIYRGITRTSASIHAFFYRHYPCNMRVFEPAPSLQTIRYSRLGVRGLGKTRAVFVRCAPTGL